MKRQYPTLFAKLRSWSPLRVRLLYTFKPYALYKLREKEPDADTQKDFVGSSTGFLGTTVYFYCIGFYWRRPKHVPYGYYVTCTKRLLRMSKVLEGRL